LGLVRAQKAVLVLHHVLLSLVVLLLVTPHHVSIKFILVSFHTLSSKRCRRGSLDENRDRSGALRGK
jgi:hypothetical protein